MKQQLLFFLLACGILSNAQVFSENFNGGSMPQDGQSIIQIRLLTGE
jgi:hypothetical protein